MPGINLEQVRLRIGRGLDNNLHSDIPFKEFNNSG